MIPIDPSRLKMAALCCLMVDEIGGVDIPELPCCASSWSTRRQNHVPPDYDQRHDMESCDHEIADHDRVEKGPHGKRRGDFVDHLHQQQRSGRA